MYIQDLFENVILFIFFVGSGFAFANFLRKLTVEKEIYFEDSHIKKTFQDTSNLQELWQWIHGVRMHEKKKLLICILKMNFF